VQLFIPNEFDKLQTVLVHRPGEEIDRLTHENMKRYLFEDIPYLAGMQEEHDEFIGDMVDHDINVTLILTRDVTRVDGIVRDESGQPVSGARIVAFPADYARWIADGQSIRVRRSLRASPSGVYSIAELPEGNYLLAAFTGDEPEGWPDRRVVESVAGVATLVRLTGGRALRQDLVPVRWRGR